MHPSRIDQSSNVEYSVNASSSHNHSHVSADDASASEYAPAHKTKASDTKPSCCVDFCGVAVINCATPTLVHPRIVSEHLFLNDTHAAGQVPSLHRPPNI